MEQQYEHVLSLEYPVSDGFFSAFHNQAPDVQARLIFEMNGWQFGDEVEYWNFKVLAMTVRPPDIDFVLKGFIAFKTRNDLMLWKLTYGGAA